MILTNGVIWKKHLKLIKLKTISINMWTIKLLGEYSLRRLISMILSTAWETKALLNKNNIIVFNRW